MYVYLFFQFVIRSLKTMKTIFELHYDRRWWNCQTLKISSRRSLFMLCMFHEIQNLHKTSSFIMNYGEVQQVRRDIIAAPKPYAWILSEPQRRKRIAREVPLLPEDGWDEGAFQDDFYDEGPECDVAPGYFDNC